MIAKDRTGDDSNQPQALFFSSTSQTTFKYIRDVSLVQTQNSVGAESGVTGMEMDTTDLGQSQETTLYARAPQELS